LCEQQGLCEGFGSAIVQTLLRSDEDEMGRDFF
jgi:hypothetical protein